MTEDSGRVPENTPQVAGVFVSKSLVGEQVQKWIDDPDVIDVTVTKPIPGSDWFVECHFAVMDLDEPFRRISHRLQALAGDNPTFR
jgi:hypothetical protein